MPKVGIVMGSDSDMKVMGHVSMLRGMAEGLYEEEKKQGN